MEVVESRWWSGGGEGEVVEERFWKEGDREKVVGGG